MSSCNFVEKTEQRGRRVYSLDYNSGYKYIPAKSDLGTAPGALAMVSQEDDARRPLPRS